MSGSTPARPDAFALDDTYVHIDQQGDAQALDVRDQFWESLGSGEMRLEGRLIGSMHCAVGSSSWEMHPKGDEFLYCVAGNIDVVLATEETEHTLSLRTGMACVVPRGVWHRQLVREPSELLFMTCGDGTEHRDVISG